MVDKLPRQSMLSFRMSANRTESLSLPRTGLQDSDSDQNNFRRRCYRGTRPPLGRILTSNAAILRARVEVESRCRGEASAAAAFQSLGHYAGFQREAQALAALNHLNIATIHGPEENSLIMERVVARRCPRRSRLRWRSPFRTGLPRRWSTRTTRISSKGLHRRKSRDRLPIATKSLNKGIHP